MHYWPKIALVEDDDDLRMSIEDFLTSSGYSVWGVRSAESFYKRFAAQQADIVVLDLGLPGESGLTIIEVLRENPQVSIIILSARDSAEDRLEGLKSGADRYLVKPISLRELVANIEAVSRRGNGEFVAKGITTTAGSEVNVDAGSNFWGLDTKKWMLLTPDGSPLGLTTREYLLVRLLVSANGEVVVKKKICDEIFGSQILNSSERLNVLIARFRKKALQRLGIDLPIKTAHLSGYAFTANCRMLDAAQIQGAD